MDLFVINRYREEIEDVDLITQETKHLQRLKQKIQERKNTYAKLKPPQEITLKEKSSEQKPTQYDNSNEPVAEIDVPVEEIIPNKDKKTPKEKNKTDFKVLGINDFEKKSKVKRVLPYWLSHPLSVSTSLQQLACKVEDQNWLHPTLKATLLSEGVINLFPVQEQVVPFVIEEHKINELFWPHDICVSAPTGSGKTLSFVLPVIQVLMNDVGRHVRALVVLPVQELAIQVAKVFKKYCTKTGLKVALMSGSIPLRQEQQQIVQYTESCGWVSEVDIIVCTAGRLVEHIQNTEGFSLKHLKLLIIDEADRIMDHIQNDWLYHLDRHIKLENQLMSGKVPNLSWNSLSDQKPPPHKMLFSATLSQDPEKLEQWSLFQPKLFSAGPVNAFEDEDQIRKYTTPDELTENIVLCNGEDKPVVLYHFLAEKKWDKVLCFTNAAQSAHRLAVLLNTWGDGTLKVAELSAALSRSNREEVLKKFTNSEINVLIGTDALARGIDIPFCDYVISYDLPKNIKTYIHRVGRTGRAGRKGTAITMLLQNQLHQFQGILSHGQKCELPEIKIEPEIINNLSSAYEHAMTKTKQLIHEEIDTKVKKSIALKRGAKTKPIKRKYDDARK